MISMQVVQAPRASTILFNLLAARSERAAPWLLPANICPIVPLVFLKCGVPFEFVDIAEDSLGMDADQALSLLSRRSFGGLVYAHGYGDETTPDSFFGEAKRLRPELLVVDDRCLCVPETEPRRSEADVLLYSTGYSKIVDLGSGGHAFLADSVAYRAVSLPFAREDLERLTASYKREVSARNPFVYRDGDWLETDTPQPSWNEYAGRIGSLLPAALEHRRAINSVYSARLPSEIQLPERYQRWRFNIRTPRSTQALEALFAGGLFASSHYPSLAGVMGPGRAPRAEALGREIVNLFNDRRFDMDRAERACAILRNVLA
jgi:hypothetical protein